MHEAKWILAVLLLAASLAGAQEVNEPGELPSLEEIDRQLNNPLSKTWALTLQDNIGIQEGDLVDGSTWSNLLFFQPLLPVPVSENLMFSGRPVFSLVTTRTSISPPARPTATPPVTAISNCSPSSGPTRAAFHARGSRGS